MSTYDEVLKELENSYKQGEISESAYQELKQRYSKLRDDYPSQKAVYAPVNLKVFGSQEMSSEVLSIAGMGRIQGGMVLKQIEAAGMIKILNDVEINGMECAGFIRSRGSIKSHGDINLAGAARVTGNVSVNGKVKVAGSLKVKGSISANEVNIDGFTRIDGSITAEQVMIKRESQNVRLPQFWRSKIFGDIVGRDIVELKDVRVKGNVQGRVVKIGKNCKIDGKVYYVDDLVVTGSPIENSIKISLDELN
ncbi:MAG: polymer-forming cytoskeletal protein [Promethearchaeota archaeon]